MKSPTSYGSENEETRFIRRVAAPDRPSNKRRQKKRLAVAGATIGLLAASAGVGYATMRASNASSEVETAKLSANMANDAFVSKLGDAFHVDFDEVDADHNGELSGDEILADLNDKETTDVKRVMKSDLPDDIKSNVVALLKSKLQSDSDCAKQALDSRSKPVVREDHETFYYMLDVFCPRVTIAVAPPDHADEEIKAAAPKSQQTVEIPTPYGGTTEVLIIGEPVDGKQTIAFPDDDGGYTTTEVKTIETPTGEQKILIPNAEGDISPVVVPQLPAEVTENFTEDTQVVDVVTSGGKTEQVIVEGEPENGEQTVEIPDNMGGYIETKAEVVESPTEGEELIVRTADGDIIEVPVSKPLPETESEENPFVEEPKPVLQTVDVVNSNDEHEPVVIVGDVDDGKQTIKVANEDDEFTEKEAIAVETDQGKVIVVPDGDGGTTVVSVPNVPDVIAEMATDDTQVVNVVDPNSGVQEQVVIEGEPEHGKVTVEVVDESGEVTTEQAKAVETSDGLKVEVPTDDGYLRVAVPDVPPQMKEEIVEENPVPPVLQTVDVVTPSGEEKQVIIEGEPDNGKVAIEIPNNNGRYTETEAKAIETDDGVKMVIPESHGETTVVTVPDVPADVTGATSDDVLVMNIESPSGEKQQVIVDGKPKNGVQTVHIVDRHGATTTEELKVEESDKGVKMVVLTDGGYIPLTIPHVPEKAKEEVAQQAHDAEFVVSPFDEEGPVVETITVVNDEGEQQQVILVGDIEDGKQTIEVADEASTRW
ncbi:unnamed protein product [Phytophthora fragariaefolia]|uniref:Unnamed protein product n=1 Tax=Phytophthora fragariaefolia TaxID=1490495 RepID=A0A9W7D619_9STRA|nr:unnamed protein product [Phytophthora fragariaefolia]